MLSTHNPFGVLEEVVDEKTTNDLQRKVKKKLKEIERLKNLPKEGLSEQQVSKINTENYWRQFLPSRQKRILKNNWGIYSTFNEIGEKYLNSENECPICLTVIKPDFIVRTNCSHIYCATCIKGMIMHENLNCSLCREDIWDYHFNDEDIRIELTNLMFTRSKL